MRYFGDSQRPLSETYCLMNRETDSMSGSTPQKSLSLNSPTGFEKPVPTGSMRTTSIRSSGLYALSTTWYGGGGVGAASATATRRGPRAPMCSQIDEDPGPPL